MLANYRAVFRTPGTAAFCAAGLVMRLPISMYPLAIVLIVSARTGHYGFAGVLSGCYVLGGVGNPVLARLVDRYGQRPIVLPSTGVHLAADATLIVLFETHAAQWTLIVPALVLGFSYVSVVSIIRARWSYMLSGRPELTTAFSLESVLDEVVFIVGPLVATVIATQVNGVLVLVLCGGLVGLGAVWLAAQTATEPPVHPRDASGQRSALRVRGMLLMTAVAVAMGGIFAGAEVSMVAFCGQHGSRGASGAVLACFAFGSGTAGFLYGTRHWHTDVLTRFRVHAIVFGLLTLVFFAAQSVPVLALLAFVVGSGIAPTIITAFGLIERTVPASSLTEGMAWLTTGLNLGYGAAAASVGRLADAHGARASFAVAVGAGLLMGALALVLHQRLRRPASEPLAVGI
ncbi:MAG TPA: MFS transporter [Jatrophihabitans sp.]|jgi:MFS family permease|nr:MFS transporter [Jatrophihabitans sp.]